MNAVEFFKEWGYDHSKNYVELAQSEGDILPWEVELKRIVKSWELIQSKGGLENAKEDELWANELGFGYKGLAQAIRDVESVGGGV